MDEAVMAKVNALIKKAQESGIKAKKRTTRSRSSLSEIIKTKEQATLFMKLLKSA